jgi:dynein heavy chain
VLEESPYILFCIFTTDIDYSEYEVIDEFKIPPIQERVPTFQSLSKRCQEFLQEYNLKSTSGQKKLDLVLVNNAMGHLVLIKSILGLPRGHIMLIGVGGSGKQSLI